MTGRKWTTVDQEVWLRKQFPTFLQADAGAMRRKFFADVFTEWQKKWPDPDPTEEELKAAGDSLKAAGATKRQAKDKQLKAWFDNHKRPTLNGKGKATGARTLLNLTKTRVWQPWQAYADLMYENVKHEIDAGYDAAVKEWEEAEKIGEKKPNRFSFQNAFLKRRYEGETEEMKKKVEEHRLQKLDVGPDEANRQHQIAINKLPLTFATIMDNVAQQTGWNIMIMAGGPRPSEDGNISTLIYTTGKTKSGQTFEDFLGEEKIAEIEDAFDDFLNECFSAEDCASRALNESELDDKDEEVLEEEKSQPGNEETKDKQKKSNAKLEEDLKKKSNSKDNSESMRATMSDYALQRERNIAENKILLASIKDAEFYAAMDELKKRPAPVKKKSEKVKPNAEERRTSARLAAVDTRTKSTNGEMKSPSVDNTSNENSNDCSTNAEQGIGQVSETPEDETGTVGDAGGSETGISDPAEAEPADKVIPDKPLETSNTAGLPDVPAPDGDVVMTDDVNSAHHGNKVPQITRTNLSPSPDNSSLLSASLVKDSAPNTSPEDVSTTNPDSSALATSPPADFLPAPTSQSQDAAQASLPILASSHLPSDKSLPAFLTPAILARLRAVSPATKWQNLVTAFLQFELTSPPTGKLATTARPPEVAPWIKRQINKKHEPVSITTNYVSRFVAWWKAIQPAWRIDKDGLLSRNAPAKEAWTFLNKGGSAGLYVVVMALSWWISDLKTDSDRLQAWAIVDDITWVFSMLMPTVGPAIASSKRSSPDTPDNDLDKDSNPAPKRVKV